jgi:DNA-binding PadR family transcriptional regulator
VIPLPHIAVMSLLVEHPSYVFEVAKRYEARYGDVLPPRTPQAMYRMFDALEREGMVEGMAGIDTRRKTYRLTSQGARTYRAWLIEQLRGDPERIELVLRVLGAAAAGGSERLLGVLDAYERDCLAEATRMPLRAESDGLWALLAQLLEEERRLSVGVRLNWVRYARAQIQAFAEQDSRLDPE